MFIYMYVGYMGVWPACVFLHHVCDVHRRHKKHLCSPNLTLQCNIGKYVRTSKADFQNLALIFISNMISYSWSDQLIWYFSILNVFVYKIEMMTLGRIQMRGLQKVVRPLPAIMQEASNMEQYRTTFIIWLHSNS